MDRLFRKRTVSTKEAHGIPLRSNSFSNSSDSVWPEKASSSTLRKKKKGKEDGSSQAAGREGSQGREAPRVELNIRNSLMLPGLSQRFSVLLPSLSSIPANSLRDELANQRQRGGPGPAITEEEEELLFAELNDIEAYKKNYSLSPLSDNSEWDGRPPLSTTFSSSCLSSIAGEGPGREDSRGYMNTYYSSISDNQLTGSSSTPNLVSISTPDSSSSSSFPSSSPPLHSPPPTSTSFDSFATFGVGGSGGLSPTIDERNSIRTKSYGFSGGSGMRDTDYIRKMKKSASNRNISTSTSISERSISALSGDSGGTSSTARTGRGLANISVDQANAYRPSGGKGGNGNVGSPNGSDRTATRTSGFISPEAVVAGGSSNGLGKRNHSPSSSLSLGLPPPHPAPTAALPPPPAGDLTMLGRPQKHRKSMLQGLTPDQMRRMSAALVEIGRGKGWDNRPGITAEVPRKADVGDDEEETLETDSPVQLPTHVSRPSVERLRYDSNAKSDNSEHSESSSVFPYHVSPTTSSFATAIQPPSEPSSSPARVIPASPKSRDLHAQVERSESPPHLSPPLPSRSFVITEAARPVPILTPTKSRPVRHNSSLSTDSSSPIASSIPRYIPGQPRPIGSGSGRSDGGGSDSSRSATPTNPNAYRTTPTSALASSPGGRNRADSNPSPVKQPPVVTNRTTSLARSRSVQQNGSPNASLSPPLSGPSSSGFASDQYGGKRGIPTSLSQPIWRRPSSPLVSAPSIREADEESGEMSNGISRREHERDLRIYEVPSRRSVAHSRSDSGGSPHPASPYPRPDMLRAQSQQGHIDSLPEPSPESAGHRRSGSFDSVGSSYKGLDLGNGGWSPLSDNITLDEGEQSGGLKDLCGFEREEFREMQSRLVDRAKAEREALLGDMAERSFSPVPQVTTSRSFPMDLRATSPISAPAPPLSASRALSPPLISTYRATTPDISETRPTPTSPVHLGNVFTPPSAAARTNPINPIDRRPAPPPPAAQSPSLQTPSEIHDEISTPPSTNLSRRPSQNQSQSRKPSASTPGDDPEKIRDFEARIAAATAALNRTPTLSNPNSKLERKGTKKNNATMVISTPRLLSSSANLASQRLDSASPEMAPPPDGQTVKALENASGSGKKMSLRWRKLGFGKKSISSTAELYSPPIPRGSTSAPGSKESSPQKLEEPIALSALQETPPLPPTAPISNDLRGFKFPHNPSTSNLDQRPMISAATSSDSIGRTGGMDSQLPPGSVNPTSGLRQMMGKLRKGKSDDAEVYLNKSSSAGSSTPALHLSSQTNLANLNNPSTQHLQRHVPTGSDESAMAKFIAAGKAVGLNDGQLSEMLVANGMLQRSATTGSSNSAVSNTGTSVVSPALVTPHLSTMEQSSAVPVAVAVSSSDTGKGKEVEKIEEKEKSTGLGGGIFRSLSRKKSKKGLVGDSAKKTADSSAMADSIESRNKIVRRTLLLPEGLPATPQPYRSPNTQVSPMGNQESPTQISFGRKPSTRRKPIPLTTDDELLAAELPGASRSGRNASASSVSTGVSADEGRNQGPTAGLGFLHSRRGAEGDRMSSASGDGSLYDLYGDQGQDEGRLVGERGDGNKGIEIMEYEDGRVVWGVIDALRDDEDGEVSGSEYTQPGGSGGGGGGGGLHSRNTSYASSNNAFEAREVAANQWKGHVAPLQLRHRERGPPQVRPETNLYFTSPTDIGDLIDQLSRDPSGNKGRIDFLLPSPEYPLSPHTVPPTQTATPPPQSGQFEDAPSPRRVGPPPPISVPRSTNNIPAGGFSPKRQKYVRGGGFGQRPSLSLGAGVSPSAASFASSQTSGSGGGGIGGLGGEAKPVEDRLQALMDRLVSSGATRKV